MRAGGRPGRTLLPVGDRLNGGTIRLSKILIGNASKGRLIARSHLLLRGGGAYSASSGGGPWSLRASSDAPIVIGGEKGSHFRRDTSTPLTPFSPLSGTR